jgi:hypothetical protein
MDPGHARISVALALLATLAVAGCELVGGDSTLGRMIFLRNDTAEIVTIYPVRSGEEILLVTLEPHQTWAASASTYEHGCLPDPMVARLGDGTLIDQQDDLLCTGATWTISGGPPPDAS